MSASHYLYRMTVLEAISLLAPVLTADSQRTENPIPTMLDVVVNAAKDRSTQLETSPYYVPPLAPPLRTALIGYCILHGYLSVTSDL